MRRAPPTTEEPTWMYSAVIGGNAAELDGISPAS